MAILLNLVASLFRLCGPSQFRLILLPCRVPANILVKDKASVTENNHLITRKLTGLKDQDECRMGCAYRSRNRGIDGIQNAM